MTPEKIDALFDEFMHDSSACEALLRDISKIMGIHLRHWREYHKPLLDCRVIVDLNPVYRQQFENVKKKDLH